MEEAINRELSLESIKQMILTGTFVFLLLGVFILLLIIVYRIRQNKMLAEKEEMKNTFEQTLLQSQLEIQEQTLKNISQEIHDNVGQVLTLAKLNLATTNVADQAANEKIKTSQHLIGKAIQDLRDLSKSLNTEYVEEMGLLRSIEYELELLQKTETIDTAFSIHGKVIKFEKQKELILFRIVQETIHNIIKHADAKKINAAISFADEEMKIVIKDDGKGFDLSPLNDAGNQTFGLGLRNMTNRATLIGAKFSISSILAQGTEVYISLPFNGDANEGRTKN